MVARCLLMKSQLKPLIMLAYPLILAGLAQNAVYFFETIFLSKLGIEVLAAGSLVGWMAATFIVVLFGVLSSINILVSHIFGSQKYDEIALVVRDGLRLSTILTIPSFIIYWYMDIIFLWLGQDPSILPLAKLYLHALAWGILPSFLLMSLLELLMGIGHSHVIMKFGLLTVVVTIIFSFIFIFGHLGFPKYGIAGAGWGITAGEWVTFIAMTIYLYFNPYYHIFFKKTFTLTPSKYIAEMVKVGLPMGMMYGIEVTFLFVLSLLVGYFGGPLFLAANQVALQYLSLTMALIFCISQAITVRMGHLLGGKQNRKQVNFVIKYGLLLSFGFTFILSLIFWVFPQYLIGVDIDISNSQHQIVVKLATQFLFLCGIFQIFEALRLALFGAIRAFKETQFTMWVSLLSLWLIALPLGFVLGYKTSLGPFGLWWGMIIGVMVGIVALFWRLNQTNK